MFVIRTLPFGTKSALWLYKKLWRGQWRTGKGKRAFKIAHASEGATIAWPNYDILPVHLQQLGNTGLGMTVGPRACCLLGVREIIVWLRCLKFERGSRQASRSP